jgi:hypothetical protein
MWECKVQEERRKTAHDTNLEGCKGDRDLESLAFRNRTQAFIVWGMTSGNMYSRK